MITGEKRQRSWSLEEKQSILAAAFAPGAVTAHVARRVNISTGQLYTWRKQLMKKPGGTNGFSQVVVTGDDLSRRSYAGAGLTPAMTLPPATSAPGAVSAPMCELPAIEVEVRGSKVRIPPTMPAALASAVVRALVRR